MLFVVLVLLWRCIYGASCCSRVGVTCAGYGLRWAGWVCDFMVSSGYG